jgi:hypothetical protein
MYIMATKKTEIRALEHHGMSARADAKARGIRFDASETNECDAAVDAALL